MSTMAVGAEETLSRRDLNRGAVALIAVSVAGLPAMMLGNAGRLTSLMQFWRLTLERYDRLHYDVSTGGLRDIASLDEPRRQMVASLAAIMNTRAQCRDDVLQKYRALDGSLIFTKTDRDFSEDQYRAWCLMLEREAWKYSADLNPFWRGAT